MKTILCYGDSNTWGADPILEARFDHHTRWPRVLQKLLNEGRPPDDPACWVVEEGLCGRTSVRDDPVEGDGRNGLRHLIPILESHKPVDLVVILLGTNDLKQRFRPSPFDIAWGVKRVVMAAQNSRAGPGDAAPTALMVCPPPTTDSPGFRQKFGDMFGDCAEISTRLPRYFRQAAKECGAPWFDAGGVVKSSPADGIHWEKEEHRKFAEALADVVKNLLSAS
ncbi:MAG: SGNH/GDSL hydrolase family protein [Spirochaetaceae bacterium]|jgi:lysophospholipase L1-like esterase|nr:SGNH/GDSL hydrolase family protein [Spirochaetaceae bacterium]